MIIKKINIQPTLQKVSFNLAKNQQILLMPIGDIHFVPNSTFPSKALKDHINWGLKRGAWFLGMGEYLDFTSASQRTILRSLRGHQKAQIDSMIQAQADELLKILKPSKGRWLGMLEGDHRWEFQAGEDAGTSVDQYFCKQLGCDFFGTLAGIRLHFVDAPKNHSEADCLICAHHGIGSSRTQGGHLHRVEDMLKWFNSDIYLMGHSHSKATSVIDRQEITPDGKHYHRTKILARTGAWLRGYLSHEPYNLNKPANVSRGTYVEQYAYTPSALGGLCIGIGYSKIPHSKFYRPTLHYSV